MYFREKGIFFCTVPYPCCPTAEKLSLSLTLKPAVKFSNNAERDFIPTLHLPFSSPHFVIQTNMTVVSICHVYNALVTSKRIENSIPSFLPICLLDGYIALYPSYSWCYISEKSIALQSPFCVCLLVFQCIRRRSCRLKKKKKTQIKK